LHFVSSGGWSDERILSKVRELVMPQMQRHGPIEAWIIDDTGFPRWRRKFGGNHRRRNLRLCETKPKPVVRATVEITPC